MKYHKIVMRPLQEVSDYLFNLLHEEAYGYGFNGSFRRHMITSNTMMWQLYLITLACQLCNFLVICIVSQIYSFGALCVSAACIVSE